ncbi:MAG: DoxX family protein [Anaerolineae bacterium]|nr:DoxX family protein [Anaerolineae bacterium]
MVTKQGTIVTNPPIARLLFEDTRFSVVWLVVRVLLGLAWIDAASHKLGVPGWMETGASLKGFWTNAIKVDAATGKGPIAFDWYRSFLQGMLDSGAYVWFAKLVAVGELLIGVALILGAFVGIAAFFGAFMNWNFIMAGTASTNPLLFVAAILLVLAWKTAGYYGADRVLLSWLGTPWGRRKAQSAAQVAYAESAAD